MENWGGGGGGGGDVSNQTVQTLTGSCKTFVYDGIIESAISEIPHL